MCYNEPKDLGYAVLCGDRGIEEEDLRFGSIDRGARGIREGIQNGFVGEGFLD